MFCLGRRVFPPGHIEILAIVGQMLFSDRVSAALAALLRHPGIVADAIEADFEV